MPIVRIALERLLHQQRQAVEALAHVGMASRQPHLHPGRKRNHRRRPVLAMLVIIAITREGSAVPVIRTLDPFANSISIIPGDGIALGGGSAAIRTGAKSD